MGKCDIPPVNSIQELAEFWDTNDLTDFEDQMVEITSIVFEAKPIKDANEDQE